MAKLADNSTNFITVAETTAQAPVSEATFQKIGGAANFMMDSTAGYNAHFAALDAQVKSSFVINSSGGNAVVTCPAGHSVLCFVFAQYGGGGAFYAPLGSTSANGTVTAAGVTVPTDTFGTVFYT